MKKILAVLFSLACAVPLLAQTRTRYLVSMRHPAAVSGLHMLRDPEQVAAHEVRTYRNFDLFAADLTDSEVNALRKSPDVKYVSAVVPRYVDGEFEHPLRFGTTSIGAPASHSTHRDSQTVWYGIDLVHARDVWQLSKGGKGDINVAVIDTGVDYNHPELKDRYQGGYNAFTKTNDPLDDHGHGTHVSGIICADDNNIGVVGVAPEMKLWVAKVLDSRGSGTDETVIAGLDWVINKKHELGGNWVVNLSLGAAAGSDPEREEFAKAIAEGIVIVAAAGNSGDDAMQYPAAYDQVLAVSAIDDKSQIANFSTFGPGLAFASPGVRVLSSVPVGTGRDLSVDSPAGPMNAWTLMGSKDGEVTGTGIYCGLGKPDEIPASVKGNIAIIKRGDIPFHEKAKNAIEKGAVGVVICPNDDRNDNDGWTLLLTCIGCPPDPSLLAYPWGVVLSVKKDDGDALMANAGQQVTLSNSPDDYEIMSGTSMASPHATGVAALVWSLAPTMSASELRLALKLSADDIGDPGKDVKFGYGRIDALSAAKYVAPGLFGLPPTPPPVPTRRRPSSHH